eukprot:960494-Amphidinium_carterae.6
MTQVHESDTQIDAFRIRGMSNDSYGIESTSYGIQAGIESSRYGSSLKSNGRNQPLWPPTEQTMLRRGVVVLAAMGYITAC